MRILLLEDNVEKALKIEEFINVSDKNQRRSVTKVSSLSDGARLLGSREFELIIIDLMLPYMPGGEASSSAGIELLRQVKSASSQNKKSTVIGISAFPDEVNQSRRDFENAGALLISYGETSEWQNTLGNLIDHLEGRSASRIDVDFVGICALEEERTPFSKFANVEGSAVVSGLNSQFIRMKDSPYRGVIIRLSAMGLVNATLETAFAIQAFRSKVFFMSGICAGVSRNSSLGQLVIASPAWEYQAGKWSSNKFEIAPSQVDLDPSTRAIIDQAIDDEHFVSHLEDQLGYSVRRPQTRSKPILAPAASGSAVIADKKFISHIASQHRKITAIDMETFGVYSSLWRTQNPLKKFFSIKAVVDFADKDKDDDIHHYGCHTSAKAALLLASKLISA